MRVLSEEMRRGKLDQLVEAEGFDSLDELLDAAIRRQRVAGNLP